MFPYREKNNPKKKNSIKTVESLCTLHFYFLVQFQNDWSSSIPPMGFAYISSVAGLTQLGLGVEKQLRQTFIIQYTNNFLRLV
jgi:hypothetical protein